MAFKRIKQGRSAADFLPAAKSLPALKKAAASCKGCDLYKRATQTVFGEGPKDAAVVFECGRNGYHLLLDPDLSTVR